MKPISDEDLILYYYGEASDGHEIERQLEISAELRQRFETLRRLLDTVAGQEVPEPHPAYGSRIWHRIAPQIERASSPAGAWRRLLPRQGWAVAATVGLLVLGAFVAGRMLPRSQTPEMASRSLDGRERIVLMTVAGHLERSEMLLLELVNTPDNGDVDLSIERQLARELGSESRLYRQAASRVGQSDVAALLEQLERVLIELSQGPQTVSMDDLGELRLRLDEGNVLFKVRVLGSRIRQEVRAGEDDYANGDGPREI